MSYRLVPHSGNIAFGFLYEGHTTEMKFKVIDENGNTISNFNASALEFYLYQGVNKVKTVNARSADGGIITLGINTVSSLAPGNYQIALYYQTNGMPAQEGVAPSQYDRPGFSSGSDDKYVSFEIKKFTPENDNKTLYAYMAREFKGSVFGYNGINGSVEAETALLDKAAKLMGNINLTAKLVPNRAIMVNGLEVISLLPGGPTSSDDGVVKGVKGDVGTPGTSIRMYDGDISGVGVPSDRATVSYSKIYPTGVRVGDLVLDNYQHKEEFRGNPPGTDIGFWEVTAVDGDKVSVKGKSPGFTIPNGNGNDGKSAYQLWLEAGHQGSQQYYQEWLRGPKGAPGKPLTITVTAQTFSNDLKGQYGIVQTTGPNEATYKNLGRGITIMTFDTDLRLKEQKHFDVYVTTDTLKQAMDYMHTLVKSIVVIVEGDASYHSLDEMKLFQAMGGSPDLYNVTVNQAGRQVIALIGMTPDFGLKPGQGYSSFTEVGDKLSTSVVAAVGGQGIILNGASVAGTFLNVTDYGAVADGTTDNSAAIQSAIDAAGNGGTVFFPAGTYRIKAHLNLKSGVTLLGDSQVSTKILQKDSDAHTSSTDVHHVTIKNLTFTGPGMNASNGGGIFFGRKDNDNTLAINMENVTVEQCVGGGISISCPITSAFTNVRTLGIVGNGFSFYQEGTSVVFNNCYAITCTQAGFYMGQMNYCTFNACAAEVNGIGFHIAQVSNNIVLNGCGCEDQIPRDKADNYEYRGVDYQIEGGVGNALVGCYSRNNEYAGIVVAWGNPVIMSYRQIGKARYSIIAPKDSDTTIINPFTTSPMDVPDHAKITGKEKMDVTYIAKDTDLNSIKTPGNYSGRGATGLKNVPFSNGNWFNLLVFGDDDCLTQVITNSTQDETWVRTATNSAGQFRAWKNLNSDGMYRTMVDLTSSNWDQNTWYPVVNEGYYRDRWNKVEVNADLGDSGKPAWSTHGQGFTNHSSYKFTFPSWGSINPTGTVEDETTLWTRNDSVNPVHLDMNYNNGGIVLYLRGGGRYRIGYNNNANNWSPYHDGWTKNSVTFNPTTEEPTSFKATKQTMPGSKFTNIPALANWGGELVNLVDGKMPSVITENVDAGLELPSTQHGTAQVIEHFRADQFIGPDKGYDLSFKKGDIVYQSMIVRTNVDARLNSVAFWFKAKHGVGGIVPAHIEYLGEGVYKIWAEKLMTIDSTISCLELSCLGLTNWSHLELDCPFVAIKNTWQNVNTNLVTIDGRKVQNGGSEALGIGYITLNANHNQTDPFAWSLGKMEANTNYKLTFTARGTGTFQTYVYPNAVLSEDGVTGDGRRTFHAKNAWTKYEIYFKTLSNIGTGNKNLLIRIPQAGNEANGIQFSLDDIRLEKVGGGSL